MKNRPRRFLTLLVLAFALLPIATCSTDKGDRAAQKEGAEASYSPDASLTNTYWKLVELDGRAASLGAGEKELNMVLMTEESGVRGFAGCNRFTGTYNLDGDQLHFGPLASTRRACMEGMDQERRFLDAIGSVKRFTISGDSLALYSAEQQLILRFEAVYLE